MQFSLSTFPPRRLRVLVLTVLSAVLLLAPFSQAQAVPVWQINTLDSAGDVGQYTSLALDSAGFPVISYFDVTNGDLKLMHCNDAICAGNNENVQIVDSSGTAIVGTFSSLVLDAAGNPVISYRNSSSNDLKLAHCNDVNCAGNNESLVTVDGAGGSDVGQYTSLVLDASGFPVISYYDVANADLKLVHCNDANCVGSNETFQTIDSTGDVGRYTSLRLDSVGNPVISYYDVTNFDLKLAHCSNANCSGINSIQIRRQRRDRKSRRVHLAGLDASGFPVISYRNVTSGDLKLVHCNDANCAGSDESTQTVDSTGVTGSYTSLALTTAGLPVISYRDSTNGDLRLAKCSDVNCATKSLETVDGSGGVDVGEFTSLALGRRQPASDQLP